MSTKLLTRFAEGYVSTMEIILQTKAIRNKLCYNPRHTNSEAEGVRNIVAECLGLLLLDECIAMSSSSNVTPLIKTRWSETHIQMLLQIVGVT
jgi:hypothetical protein